MTNLDLIFDPFDLAKIILEDQSSNLELLKLLFEYLNHSDLSVLRSP